MVELIRHADGLDGDREDDFQVSDLCNWVYQDLLTEMRKG